MAIRQSQYRALLATGSLKAFYDDIVYWEMAKIIINFLLLL